MDAHCPSGSATSAAFWNAGVALRHGAPDVGGATDGVQRRHRPATTVQLVEVSYGSKAENLAMSI
jgi:hypothetical protein